MTRTTVTALFENRVDALNAACDLAAMIPRPDIAILCHHADDRPPPDAGSGAALPDGLTLVAMPGIGPVAAAGWLAAADAEPTAQGLIGRLTVAGLRARDAHVCAEAVRRGGSLVGVRLEVAVAEGARTILKRHNPLDADRLGDSYRLAGWSAFDEDAAPYTHSDVQRLRAAGGNPPSI